MIRRRTLTTGAVALAAAPFAARAQAPGRTYRIAVWHLGEPIANMGADGVPRFRAFFQELRRIGFVEGRNLAVDRYATEGHTERYEPTARAIVDSRPDVIVPNGPVPARFLLNFTTAIPFVIPSLGDPIALGLVQSIARPGGNLTGFTNDGGIELYGLRLQLLKEAVPRAARLGFLVSRNLLLGDEIAGVLQRAATRLEVELVIQVMSGSFDETGYRAAIAELSRRGVEGLYVGNAAEFLPDAKLIAKLVAEARLPAVYHFREMVDDGGLMSYGVDLVDNWRKAAGYVARILNGEKPGDLPIQQPTTLEFVVNLKTAKALGIALPESIMIRATEVIE